MKYIKQLFIILLISFAGEILNKLIPLPLPGSVYGIVLLFLALALKIIPLEKVEGTADFMLSIMPVLFIPAGAGLMTVSDKIFANIFEIAVITIISTILVMAVTGIVSQAIMNRKDKKEYDK